MHVSRFTLDSAKRLVHKTHTRIQGRTNATDRAQQARHQREHRDKPCATCNDSDLVTYCRACGRGYSSSHGLDPSRW